MRTQYGASRRKGELVQWSFGRNLQHLRRLSRNMTQEALAERLGVSRQTVSKWEMDAAQLDMDVYIACL